MAEPKDLVCKALSRQLQGTMFHHEMVEYFEFLTLPGFAEIQRYRFDDELETYKCLHKWYIEQFNTLPKLDTTAPSVVPSDWYKYTRFDVNVVNRQHGVKDGFKLWIDWEENTRSIFVDAYKQLLAKDLCPYDVQMIPLIEDVSNEIANAEEIAFSVSGMNYDMPTIMSMQNEYYQTYHKKKRESILNRKVCRL